MRKLVLIPLLSLWAVIALADPQPKPGTAPAPTASKLAKLHLMLDSLHLTETLKQDQTICVQEALTGIFSPAKVVADKGSYRGFRPGTAQWPKVLAAYQVYTDRYCSYLSDPRIEQAYIKFYDSKLSESDLDAYLAFQKTPAGQHFRGAQQEAVANISAAMRDISEPVIKDATDKLTVSLDEICSEEPSYKMIFCHS